MHAVSTYNLNETFDILSNLEESEWLKGNPTKSLEVLCQIVWRNDSEALELYLEKGLDINVRDRYLRTVAHFIGESTVEFVELMIEKGLNIHAVNLLNENALIHLFKKGASKPLKELLMSKGLNPYNRTIEGMDCVRANLQKIAYSRANGVLSTVGTEDLHQWFRELGYSKRDQDVAELINDGLKVEALELAYQVINNLGGIEEVLEKSHTTFPYLSLLNLQKAFMANNMMKEANALVRLVLDTSNVPYSHLEEDPLSFVPAIFENDTDTLGEYLELLEELNSFSERQTQRIRILGYMLFNTLESSKYKKVFDKKFKKQNLIECSLLLGYST